MSTSTITSGRASRDTAQDAPPPGPTASGSSVRAPERTGARWSGRSVASYVLSPFLAGLACLAGIVATWWAFVDTARGQRLDELAFRGATIGAWRVADHLLRLLMTVSVEAVAVIVLVVVCIALFRRRAALAFEAAAVVIGANVTTRVLKYQVFSRPRLLTDADNALLGSWNSLPSGHTTVAASAVIAIVLVVPRRVRPLVALGATVIGVLFGWATLVNQWHRPSDVVAGMLVSFGWGFAALFLGRLRSAWRRRDDHSRLLPDVSGYRARRTTALLAVVGLVCLVVGVVAIVRSWNVPLADATRRQQFLAYAGSAVGFSGVMTLGVALFLWMASAPSARGRAR